MFQPETEDLLPRMAPKPSASAPMGTTEPIIRPQVPEVSILFGAAQPGTNLQMQQQTQQPTSYAAWKKQILPKVSYPPCLAAQEHMNHQEVVANTNNNAGQEYNLPRSNLYPLRTAVMPAVSMAFAGNVNSNLNVASSSNQVGYNGGVSNGITQSSSYRRSLDSCSNNINYQSQNPYRKLLESTPPSGHSPSNGSDVLTICAGTQTDAVGSPHSTVHNAQLSNVASKQDVEEIKQLVQEMRHDQLRFFQILETFIFSQHAPAARTVCKDAAVQAGCDDKESSPNMNGCCLAPAAAPTNKFIEHLKSNVLQTPKGKPMAQSTTYRPNSPQSNRLQERQQISSPPPAQIAPMNYQQPVAILPKSANDKSLVMNELALKYLPNEKLTELLRELNITQPLAAVQKQINEASPNKPTTPLRNAENFERNATDISNASYKYLKKYRLLPEDHDEDGENEKPAAYNTDGGQNHQYDALRNSPGHQQHRQQPNVFPHKSNSPYPGRLPTSPLVTASPPPLQYRDNMLNLENIRQQPKFL